MGELNDDGNWKRNCIHSKYILCIDRQIKDSSLTDDHSENSQNDKRK